MNGFLNLLKPPGLTSHDVVEFVRKLFRGVKVGHGGTLDPGAAGVLPLLLGKATRLSSYLLDFPKVYRAELYLGISTDTADSSGKIIGRTDFIPFKLEEIEKAIESFKGEIKQIPPMFAAVKHKGKKLYQYAREGKTVERRPRIVRIYSAGIIKYSPPARVLLEVKCSKGTYVRTLCSQIGDALGCGGHMSFLLRKEVGPFTLPEARTMEEFKALALNKNIGSLLLPLDFPFQTMDRLILANDCIRSLAQGSPLPQEFLLKAGATFDKPVDEKLLPVYTTKREFALMGRWKKKDSHFVLKPEKVFKLS